MPDTGTYSINATINYTMPTTTSPLASGITPYFSIRSSDLGDVTIGHLPILDISNVIMSFRAVLSTAAVTLSNDITLTAGDELYMYYEADGLTQPLQLGDIGVRVNWSV